MSCGRADPIGHTCATLCENNSEESQGRRNWSISVEARPKGEHTRLPLHQSLHGGQVICDNQSVERQRMSVVREAALAAGKKIIYGEQDFDGRKLL